MTKLENSENQPDMAFVFEQEEGEYVKEITYEIKPNGMYGKFTYTSILEYKGTKNNKPVIDVRKFKTDLIKGAARCKDLAVFKSLKTIFKLNTKKCIEESIIEGNLPILEYLMSSLTNKEMKRITLSIFHLAINNQQLPIVKYLSTFSPILERLYDMEFIALLSARAIKKCDNVEILKYLNEKLNVLRSKDCNISLCLYFAYNKGDKEFIKYLFENFNYDDIIKYSASALVQYINQYNKKSKFYLIVYLSKFYTTLFDEIKSQIDKIVVRRIRDYDVAGDNATEDKNMNDLAVVKYLHTELNAELAPELMEYAVEKRNMSLIQYLEQYGNHLYTIPCIDKAFRLMDLTLCKYLNEMMNKTNTAGDNKPIITSCPNFETEAHALEFITYLREHCGVEFDEDNLTDIISYNNWPAVLDYLHKIKATDELDDLTLTLATCHSSADIVDKLINECHAPFNHQTILWAALGGNLSIVKSIHSYTNIKYTETVVCIAAYAGHLQLVEYFYDNYPSLVTDTALCHAVRRGHLTTVDYLVKRGFKCDADAVDFAAFFGHLPVIKYLYDKNNKCKSWVKCTDLAMRLAAAKNHVEIVTFLYENTPLCIDLKVFEYALEYAAEDVIRLFLSIVESLTPIVTLQSFE